MCYAGDILLCALAVLLASQAVSPRPAPPQTKPEPTSQVAAETAAPTLRDYEIVYLTPLTQGEKSTVTTDFGASLAELVTADLGADEKDADHVQLLRITNRHASNTLCYGDEAWSGSDDCSTICSSSSMTCNGSSTDGAPVPPGESVTDVFDGTSCICARADAASTTATVERTVRDATP